MCFLETEIVNCEGGEGEYDTRTESMKEKKKTEPPSSKKELSSSAASGTIKPSSADAGSGFLCAVDIVAGIELS